MAFNFESKLESLKDLLRSKRAIDNAHGNLKQVLGSHQSPQVYMELEEMMYGYDTAYGKVMAKMVIEIQDQELTNYQRQRLVDVKEQVNEVSSYYKLFHGGSLTRITSNNF